MMAINISLYQITEPENVFPKTIGTAVATHTITLKDGCSIDKPTVSFSGGSSIMATLNYAYIDAFGRYYFIRDRNMTVNGVCELTLESDPLQSFSTEIKACTATITRNQNVRQGYLSDSGYNALAYQGVQYKTFPNALTDASYILVTVG
jgi:hypothetical protein